MSPRKPSQRVVRFWHLIIASARNAKISQNLLRQHSDDNREKYTSNISAKREETENFKDYSSLGSNLIYL
jgi:hypothetical protein